MNPTTPNTKQVQLINIAKALHGKPDPVVLFEYGTYDEFWKDMAASPAVIRLGQLLSDTVNKALDEVSNKYSKGLMDTPDDFRSAIEQVRKEWG